MIYRTYILGILLFRIVKTTKYDTETSCVTLRNQSSDNQLSLNPDQKKDTEGLSIEQLENQPVEIITRNEVLIEHSTQQDLGTKTDDNSIFGLHHESETSTNPSMISSCLTSKDKHSDEADYSTQNEINSHLPISSGIISKKDQQKTSSKDLEISSSSRSSILEELPVPNFTIDKKAFQTGAEHILESATNLSSISNFNSANDTKPSSGNLSTNMIENEQFDKSVTENQDDDDAISDLLTFEEWVEKNVHKNNDNSKDLQKQKNLQKFSQNHQNMLASNNYLFGEENEVDFGIFSDSSSSIEDEENSPISGKYQKRFNFASADCAANVIKTNKEAKGASALLIENKESYMLNECHVEQSYVIIELCEDILIDTVSVGNYEYFSSTFRDIEILASDRYPIPDDDWESLGGYEAKNIREMQSFSIKNPAIWARYLKIKFKSHYGNKFYCPVSSVKVHGRTMMDEYKIEESKKTKSDSMESDVLGQIGQRESSDRTKMIYDDTIENLQWGKENIKRENGNESDMSINKKMNAEICSENKKRAYGFNEFLDDLKKDDLCESVTLLNESQYPIDEMKVRILVDNDTLKTSTSNKRGSDTNNNGGQESIYKNIMNRLSILELNSTLSMLYFAEQSKVLSEAFLKLERKQKKKFNLLVMALNDTLQLQMEEFKKSFASIRKESELLIESQSEFNAVINDKIDNNFKLLSEELSFQKKLSFIFFMMFICLLMFVLLSKDKFIEGEFLEELLEEPSQNKSPILSNSSEESSLLEYSGQESQQPLKKKWKLKIGSSLGLMAKSPLSPTFRVFKEQSNFKHSKSYSTGNIEEDIKNETGKKISLASEIKHSNPMMTPEASDSEN